MARVGQREADHQRRQADQHQDSEQVRPPPREVGQDLMALAFLGRAEARHYQPAQRLARNQPAPPHRRRPPTHPPTAGTWKTGRARGWGWTKTCHQGNNCWHASGHLSRIWLHGVFRGRPFAGMWTTCGCWAEKSFATCTKTFSEKGCDPPSAEPGNL